MADLTIRVAASNAAKARINADFVTHVAPATLVLDGVGTWPKSATRSQWRRLTKALISGVIAEMDESLSEEEVAQVEQALISAGLL